MNWAGEEESCGGQKNKQRINRSKERGEEKQAEREREARRAGGKLSMRGDSDRQGEEIKRTAA